MTTEINEIITTAGGKPFCLQSLANVEGGGYYTGYQCCATDDPTPAHGAEPGQTYLAPGLASVENAVTDITL